jgi:hypothetical protein
VAPVRTTLVIAGIIVGLLVVAIVIFERGPASDSAPDNAETDREDSSAREASNPPAPTATTHAHAAQPALQSESAEPATGEGRRTVSGRPEVKRKATRTKVQKYAHEAYRAWLRAHSGDECPHMSDLVEYTEDKDPRDAWGHPMKVRCRTNLPGGAKGIEVVSLGRDAEESEDDIKSRSWE